MKKNSAKAWLEALFCLVLLLYPLRHIQLGVEWWDTGYNYGNFVFMEHMDRMWVFGTYLANALGHWLTGLPLGRSMLGLNLYTGLIVSGLALGGYAFSRRVLGIHPALCFWGEMLAVSLCWCPTALLYNYLGYALLLAACVCIFLALDRERPGWLAPAGVLLGANVFVRFPNLSQAALILVVYAYIWLPRPADRAAAWSKSWRYTLYSLGGYALGLALPFLAISLAYGPRAYIEGIGRLLAMPSQASDYTLYSMIIYQLQNYLQSFIWLAYMLAALACGWAAFALTGRGRWLWPKRLAFVLGIPCLLYFLMMRNMFNLKYSTKMSVFAWAVFFLSLALVLAAKAVFDKKITKRERLLAWMALAIAVLTPLGSNNHLYASINNLFFALPFLLWALWRRLMAWRSDMLREKERRPWLSPSPPALLLAALLLAATWQIMAFGWVYVFSESDGGENLHTPIEHNAVLRHMRTAPDRAEALSSLSLHMQAPEYASKSLLVYGNIPALPYYLDRPFVLTAWPDLPSYHYEVMARGIENLLPLPDEQRPLVLLERQSWQRMEAGEAEEKLELISQAISRWEYVLLWQNKKFVLFGPKE